MNNAYISQCNVTIESADLTRLWTTWGDHNAKFSYDKLYFFLDGEGFLEIDGEMFYPKPGELYIIPEGSILSSGTNKDNLFYKYWCHIDSKLIDRSFFKLVNAPKCIKIKNVTKLTEIFKALVTNFKKDDIASHFNARAAIMQMIAFIIDEISNNDEVVAIDFPNDALNIINGYIYDNLKEKITLTSISEVVHFHPNYLIKFFNKYYGTSPLQYVANVRINEAKRLLSTTNMSVKEIASKTGFYDLYHFSKRFKAKTGYSPTDYRKL